MNAELVYGEEEVTAASATYVDRGKDWPLAVVFFTPVLAAYAAIGYGIFVLGTRLL
jgi:hypothetical protein